jgi:iron(III) transport system substrate-binding protein
VRIRTETLAVLLALAAGGCRIELGSHEQSASGKAATVHVYTSMYQEVIDQVDPVIEAKLAKIAPGSSVEWFQSGSEKVAVRLDAEITAGGSPCDILMTSDPTYYARLKAAGTLVPYVSPAALKQPREFLDPDGAWAASRLSTMVIGVAPAFARGPAAPKSFSDLAKPGSRTAIGDPLSSGTNFTTLSVLSARYGWDHVKALKAKGTVVAGGNANVLTRLETGDVDAGWVLLETLLTARARGDQVEVVIPSDGAVVVPGPIALLSHARHSEAARAVYDAILSPEVQAIVVNTGRMHSPDPSMPPPAGAPALADLLAKSTPPSAQEPSEIKSTFDEIFFK